jgi:hypothetical protein
MMILRFGHAICIVIASGAKQSSGGVRGSGLLGRHSPSKTGVKRYCLAMMMSDQVKIITV